MNLRKSLPVLLLLPFSALSAEVEEVSDRWYAGVSGAMYLPGGGSSLKRAGGVSAHLGCFISDSFALETGLMSVPNAVSSRGGNVSLTGFSVRGAWHFMGFERFDPFVTFGAFSTFASGHVFADDSHRTAFGPSVGLGFLYHLSDNLALRAESVAAVAIDTPGEVAFTVSGGLQWSFGGGEASGSVAEPEYAETIVVKDDNDPAIAEAVRAIKKSGVRNVFVCGHIDCKLGMGRERAKTLSLAAAEKVKAKLIGQGVDGESVTLEGAGFSRPVKNFDFSKGSPENNRVEIRIGGKDR